MGFTGPLWVGHYGLCFTCHIALACMAIKVNDKHSQLTIIHKRTHTHTQKGTYNRFSVMIVGNFLVRKIVLFDLLVGSMAAVTHIA